MDTNNLESSHFLTIASILFWITIFYYALRQMMPRDQFGVLFLGGITTIYALNELSESIEERSLIDATALAISAIIILVSSSYLYLNYRELAQNRIGIFYDFEYLLAGLFLLVIIYFTYREFGKLFLGLVVGGLIYGYYGPYFPGLLSHSGMSIERLLQIWVLNYSGIIGFLTRLVAAWVSLFMLYAGLLQGYDAFDLILRAAAKTGKYIKSGAALSAVFASMIIGSINGSSAANTAITGSFTIPLMKDSGIESDSAAGIESIASTLGQVLPPVMGASAFIMASLLSISYITVITAGIIPAIIMIASLVLAVHYIGTRQIETAEIDITEQGISSRSRKKLSLDGLVFGIPFLVLISTLGILQWTVMTSALYTCFAMIATGSLGILIESDVEPESLTKVLMKTSDGFWNGAIILAPIAIILAAINGIVDMLLATGVPSAITLSIMSLSGGQLAIAAILSMIVCIILGLGMPTAASYVIVALLVAPTLIGEFMIPELAAHYFVFYSAILAAITPPIATSVAVATGIARSNFWGTAHVALKISVPLFILPYSFLANPAIVSGEFSLGIVTTSLLIGIGAIAIAHGLNYAKETRVSRTPDIILRSLYLALGFIAMVHLTFAIGAVSAGIIVALLLIQRLRGNPFDIIVNKTPKHPVE